MKHIIRAAAAMALAAAAAAAQALTIAPYSAAALAQAQQAGKPVAVHFHADWCPTCRAQDKSLAELKKEGGLDVTLLVADYDKERALRKALKVPAQSTIIVYHGTQERARLTGDTDVDSLRTALKAAL